MGTERVSLADLLQVFEPSPDALIDFLRAQVDDGMLREIAGNDWGKKDIDQHFAALLPIRDRGTIVPDDWYPCEVLSLEYVSEPVRSQVDRQENTTRGHLKRAFSCAVLLRMRAEPQHRNSTHVDMATGLAHLLIDTLHLGPTAIVAAIRFIAWETPLAWEENWEQTICKLGLLILAIAAGPSRYGIEAIESLVDSILDDTQGLRREHILTLSYGSTLREELSSNSPWPGLILEHLVNHKGLELGAMSEKLEAIAAQAVKPKDTP